MPYTGQKYAVGYYKSKNFDPNSFQISGVSFCHNVCKTIKQNDILECIPDPDNKYDKNAIKVITETKDICGYIPKSHQEFINDENINKLKVSDVAYYKDSYGVKVVPIKDVILS